MAMEAPRSDAVYDAVSSANLEVQFVSISLAASGDLVALVTGKKIRVLDFFLVAAGSVTVQFQSGGSTNLTGVMTMATGTPFAPGPSQFGHFQTAAGAKLNLVLGSSVQVSGYMTYVLV